MSGQDVENMTREQLIYYLIDHVYPRAGNNYRNNCWAALRKQSTETLLKMAIVTRDSQKDKQAQGRLNAAARRKQSEQHTRKADTEPSLF
jgi:hypothetical protein